MSRLRPCSRSRTCTCATGRCTPCAASPSKSGPGEIVALIGPNGGGKTSLLRALLGIGPGSAAGIRFLGEDVRGAPTHVRARRGMVLVPEGRSLFPELTIEENLRIPLIARRAKGDTGLEEVLELFPRLRERSGQRAGSLSGGEQQMLAIGRALLSSPQLLLLDEVSLGLHPRIVDDVYDALRHGDRPHRRCRPSSSSSTSRRPSASPTAPT